MTTAANPISRDQSQYLGFQVAGEEYAVGILRVKEILEYDVVTRVPMTPPSIRGVINLRGSVVPVVDLAVKLGLPESAVTKRTCIVIVEVKLADEAAVIGVIADSVSQVLDLPAAEIQAPPSFGTRVHMDYLVGMGRADRKFVLILDIDRVLSEDELTAAAFVSDPELATAVTRQQEARA
jgi:purine-binding chemotaxis protein CheW